MRPHGRDTAAGMTSTDRESKRRIVVALLAAMAGGAVLAADGALTLPVPLALFGAVLLVGGIVVLVAAAFAGSKEQEPAFGARSDVPAESVSRSCSTCVDSRGNGAVVWMMAWGIHKVRAEAREGAESSGSSRLRGSDDSDKPGRSNP